jgi:hypothetical protein
LSIFENNKPDNSREIVSRSIYRPWINRVDIVGDTQENTDHEKIESREGGVIKMQQEGLMRRKKTLMIDAMKMTTTQTLT